MKNTNKIFKGLYIANLIIIFAILLIPTIIGPEPLLVFGLAAIFTSVSFGATFLILNTWGLIKYRNKRWLFSIISGILLIWICWGIYLIMKGITLP